jgi:BirA family biotin operon repressor/biotin-[acetyl-CoA-carboxylase] ligase
VIAAENQTAGRGRLGRRWHSPPGLGLWFSTIVRPDPVSDPGRLTLGAAVAVADAVRDVCGVDTHLVWPNDVWVAGHKLAGILTETRMDEASIDYAAVGVGVNVNHTEDDFPEEVRDMATSLKIATGRSQPRSGLLRSILEALEAVLDLPPARIRDLWRDRSAMWGRRVQITGGSGAAEGVAEDLDVDGGLRIRSPGGELVAVHTGEVERLRVARS